MDKFDFLIQEIQALQRVEGNRVLTDEVLARLIEKATESYNHAKARDKVDRAILHNYLDAQIEFITSQINRVKAGKTTIEILRDHSLSLLQMETEISTLHAVKKAIYDEEYMKSQTKLIVERNRKIIET